MTAQGYQRSVGSRALEDSRGSKTSHEPVCAYLHSVTYPSPCCCVSQADMLQGLSGWGGTGEGFKDGETGQSEDFSSSSSGCSPRSFLICVALAPTRQDCWGCDYKNSSTATPLSTFCPLTKECQWLAAVANLWLASPYSLRSSLSNTGTSDSRHWICSPFNTKVVSGSLLGSWLTHRGGAFNRLFSLLTGTSVAGIYSFVISSSIGTGFLNFTTFTHWVGWLFAVRGCPVHCR